MKISEMIRAANEAMDNGKYGDAMRILNVADSESTDETAEAIEQAWTRWFDERTL